MSGYAAVNEAFRIAEKKGNILQEALRQRHEKDNTKIVELKHGDSEQPKEYGKKP